MADETENRAAIFQNVWEQVLPISEIISQGTKRGFKLSGEGRPLALTLVAVELAKEEKARCQIIVEQNSDLTGRVNTMVGGTVEEIATREQRFTRPEPPILIFLFDCSGVNVLRFELKKLPNSTKNHLWLFDNSAWQEVWVQP
jgi:hypothetical protein